MKIVLFGAGVQARAIVYDLIKNSDITKLLIIDRDIKKARGLFDIIEQAMEDSDRTITPSYEAIERDVTNYEEVNRLIENANCAIGATSYEHNCHLTEACIETGTHFCDLGGNNHTVTNQHLLGREAEKAGVTIIPDCGLAPGMVNILTYHWVQQFDRVDRVKIRVGGLPKNPETTLNYQLAFSIDGLINEYIESCVNLIGGQPTYVHGMTGIESLNFGEKYPNLEAFYTSGGTSTLPLTLAGKVDNLDYKTIRYQGHAQYIKFLLDLGFFSENPIALESGSKQMIVPRKITSELLEQYLSKNKEDVVLMRISIEGLLNKCAVVKTYDCIVDFDNKTGLSAMQQSTGFSIAIVAKMLASGSISKIGVVSQELAISGSDFVTELEKRNIAFTSHVHPLTARV